MKNGEIIRMAQEIGIFTPDLMCVTVTLDMVKRLIQIAQAEEREACAKVCDRFAARQMHPAECASAIRARGNE